MFDKTLTGDQIEKNINDAIDTIFNGSRFDSNYKVINTLQYTRLPVKADRFIRLYSELLNDLVNSIVYTYLFHVCNKSVQHCWYIAGLCQLMMNVDVEPKSKNTAAHRDTYLKKAVKDVLGNSYGGVSNNIHFVLTDNKSEGEYAKIPKWDNFAECKKQLQDVVPTVILTLTEYIAKKDFKGVLETVGCLPPMSETYLSKCVDMYDNGYVQYS